MRTDLSGALPRDFGAFYEANVRMYLGFAHSHLGERARTEAAVHDFFVWLAPRWGQALTRPNAPAAVWTAFRRHVARRLEVHGQHRPVVESLAFALNREDTRATLESLESRLGLYEAIAKLPDRPFDVMVLHFLLKIPQKQVAGLLGVSPATVRSHIRHARISLARDLNINWERDRGETDESG
ncbi:RNA polymerase sigma factor [Streptomyces smaragdinus]|uniref:RNA polymerase sigma factor n=1 Tax=Streptomyces smaragdinus TaxID=2585196 RepID=UPI0018866378|nr:sigma-70 family RNA polymerase sigma factor [Streptomyces smaragdinus]